MDTNTAFFAYGVYVGSAGEEADRIDEVLLTVKDQCPDVRSAEVGSVAGEQVFLVAYSKEVEPGEYRGAAEISPEQQSGWDTRHGVTHPSTSKSGRLCRRSVQYPSGLVASNSTMQETAGAVRNSEDRTHREPVCDLCFSAHLPR
jgi:hypothetical protein